MGKFGNPWYILCSIARACENARAHLGVCVFMCYTFDNLSSLAHGLPCGCVFRPV